MESRPAEAEVTVNVSIAFPDEQKPSHSDEQKISDYAKRCLGPPEISAFEQALRIFSTLLLSYTTYGELQALTRIINLYLSYVVGGVGAAAVAAAVSQGLTTTFREGSQDSIGLRERHHRKHIQKKLPCENEKLEQRLFALDHQFPPFDRMPSVRLSRAHKYADSIKEYVYMLRYPNLTLFERLGQWAATAFAAGAGYTETQEFLRWLGAKDINTLFAVSASVAAGLSCYNVTGIEFEYDRSSRSEREQRKQEIRDALVLLESQAQRREKRIQALENAENAEEKYHPLAELSQDNVIPVPITVVSSPEVTPSSPTTTEVTPASPARVGWCAQLVDKAVGLFPHLPLHYRIIQLTCTFFVTASVAAKTNARVRSWGNDSDVSKILAINLAFFTATIMMHVCYRTIGVNYTRHALEGPEVEKQGVRLAELAKINKSQGQRIKALEDKIAVQAKSDIPHVVEDIEPLSCGKRFLNTCSRVCFSVSNFSLFRKKSDVQNTQQVDIELGPHRSSVSVSIQSL